MICADFLAGATLDPDAAGQTLGCSVFSGYSSTASEQPASTESNGNE